ncbi:MAG: HAD family hydrolase [Bdellovibrionales bacterium]|nr:HAD family hydrolase [Bdellovibrionales bacterium]
MSLKEKLKNVRNIIFDLDDTLIDSTTIYEQALSEIGLSLKHPDYLAAREQVKVRLGTGHPSARNRLLYFKSLLENKRQFSARKLLDTMDKYEVALHKYTLENIAISGRAELLGALKDKGVRMAIVSNENLRTQMIKMLAVDPQNQYFEHVLFSEEMGVEKPDAKIFKEMLEKTKFNVEETLMIGDSWDADILGAADLGIRSLWSLEFIPHFDRKEHPLCLGTIAALAEIKDYIF